LIACKTTTQSQHGMACNMQVLHDKCAFKPHWIETDLSHFTSQQMHLIDYDFCVLNCLWSLKWDRIVSCFSFVSLEWHVEQMFFFPQSLKSFPNLLKCLLLVFMTFRGVCLMLSFCCQMKQTDFHKVFVHTATWGIRSIVTEHQSS